MQQAKLRSLVSESGNILTAVNSFRMQYDALPGDMNNSQSYWGVYAGGFGGTGVTNGDGNGIIGAEGGGTDKHREGKQSMRTLSLSGLLPELSAYRAEQNYTWQAGVDVPVSIYGDNVVMHLWHRSIRYGRTSSNNTNVPWNVFLTTAEAQSIDAKNDDGMAESGLVLGRDGYPTLSTCVTSGEYDLSVSGVACHLEFAFYY